MNLVYFIALYERCIVREMRDDVSVTCCQCEIPLINVVSISWKLNHAPKFVIMSLPNESGVFHSSLNVCFLAGCQCDLLSV